MSGTNVMLNYFQSGLIAARPVTPLIAVGTCAFYYATDNSHLYAWNGSAWATVI